MLIRSYPKLNLYLHIIGRHNDYHLLRSRFVCVRGKLFDEITITPRTSVCSSSTTNNNTSDISCDIIEGDFPCATEQSSVYKAVRALRLVRGAHFPPLNISVKKHIPSGAGLGGGSSNAGVVLWAIITHYGGDFTDDGAKLFRALPQMSGFTHDFAHDSTQSSHQGSCIESTPKARLDSSASSAHTSTLSTDLAHLAKGIGADVAFFLSQVDCAEVSGIGEIITPCRAELCDVRDFELYTPEIFCDTSAVYRQYRAMIDSKEITFNTQDFRTATNSQILVYDIEELNALYKPACVLYPELESVRKELGDGWYFSGSGSSFFRPLSSLKNPPHISLVESNALDSTKIQG